MSLNGVVNIEDLHQAAKRRLPKIAFDFIEGGVEDERALDVPSGRVEVAGSLRQRGVAAQRHAEHPAPMAHVRRKPPGVAVLGGNRLEQFDRPAVGRESLDVEVGGSRQGCAPERPLGFVGVDGESDVAAQRAG